MKFKLQNLILSLLTIVLISLYPGLFQFANNLPESRFGDAMIFFGIFLAIGLAVFLVLLLLLRKATAAGFIGGLALLVVINFGLVFSFLQGRFPDFPKLGLTLLGLSLLLLLAVFLLVRRKKYTCFAPLVILCILFGTLCVFQGILAAPKLIASGQERMAGHGEPPPQHSAQIEATQDLPNVYYYIFDEYGGPENLSYYYEYDSSAFYRELEQRGFSCSADSYNLESCASVQLIPGLCNLDYNIPPYFDNQDGKMPVLYEVFHSMGYQINLINHMDFLDPDGGHVLTRAQASDSICLYLYSNSILPYTPLQKYLLRLPQLQASYEYNSMLLDVMDTMKSAWRFTEGQSTMTLGYIQLPHTRFVFDREGHPVAEENWLNWGDPKYYLDQLEYTNTFILKTVDELLAHDPSAIIILQSDHGARTGCHLEELYGGPYDPEEETVHQQNILNCVYTGEKKLNIQGLSGINTLRTLLNEVYGFDYAMLPDPPPYVNYYP